MAPDSESEGASVKLPSTAVALPSSTATSSDEPNGNVEAPIPSMCPAGWKCDYQALDRKPSRTIDQVRIENGAHRLHLIAGTLVVRSYTVAIG